MAYVHQVKNTRRKADLRAKRGIFVGYPDQQRGWIVLGLLLKAIKILASDIAVPSTMGEASISEFAITLSEIWSLRSSSSSSGPRRRPTQQMSLRSHWAGSHSSAVLDESWFLEEMTTINDEECQEWH